MLNRYSTKPLLCILLGSACLGLSPVYSADYNYDERNPYPQDARNGYAEDQGASVPLYHLRRGDWDNYQNWQYDRDAYFKGETQGEAYRKEHPFGPGGIGYDADENYIREQRRNAHHHYGDNRPNDGNSQARRNSNQSNDRSNGSYAQANRNGNQSNGRSNGGYAQANRNGNQYNDRSNGGNAQANRNGQQQPNSNQGTQYTKNRYDANRPSDDNREISANMDRNDRYNKPGVYSYDSPDDRYNNQDRSTDRNNRQGDHTESSRGNR
jgi:hypothetical protein